MMTTCARARLGLPWLVLALWVLGVPGVPGCGDPQTTTQDGPRVAQDPGGKTTDHEQAARSRSADGGAAPVAPGGTKVDRGVGPGADPGGAWRSPFPEPGESVRTPYPASRLSGDDPFAPDALPPDQYPPDELAPGGPPPVVPWTEAGGYLGRVVTVEGRVVGLGRTRDGGIHFLNFVPDWRGQFCMVVFADLAETLQGGVAGTFLDRLVRVTGQVEDYRGRPQIKIRAMDQVEFIDE